MVHQPVHSFTIPVWSRPKSWVSVFIWRTLTEMRQVLGGKNGGRNYEALCLQFPREKGEVAAIHLSLTRMTPETISHEAYHATAHIGRIAEMCEVEEEEELAGLLDGIVAIIVAEVREL